MSQAQIDVNALWQYVTAQVKQMITQPSLWRAMEAARPIIVENDELILGFGGLAGHQSSLITDNRNRNVIEQVIESATRLRLKIRIIAGETLADWELAKQQDLEAQRLQEQARAQYRKQVEAGQTWEAVSEQLIRKFGSTSNRGLSSVQGRYLDEAVEVLVEAYLRLMPADPAELDERNYSRALDRLSERVGVPGSLIAYLVQRRAGGRTE